VAHHPRASLDLCGAAAGLPQLKGLLVVENVLAADASLCWRRLLRDRPTHARPASSPGPYDFASILLHLRQHRFAQGSYYSPTEVRDLAPPARPRRPLLDAPRTSAHCLLMHTLPTFNAQACRGGNGLRGRAV